eukprot:jgi/Hompol1/1217/HPOL_001059-RA
MAASAAVYTGANELEAQREVIERAWCIALQEDAAKRRAQLLRRFCAMRAAMDELERLSSASPALAHLFEAATGSGNPGNPGKSESENDGDGDGDVSVGVSVGVEGDWVARFPRRMRVPTETPPLRGWDYERNHNE